MKTTADPSYEDRAPYPALAARLTAAFGLRASARPAERWRAWRGHRLHLDVWTPQGAATATVVLVHGAGGNGRLLAPFADALCAAGARVIAPDLPGYGLTVPARGWRPDYADWVEGIAELAGDEARAGGGPVVLFGLSMGGLTALWAAQKAPPGAVSGVIATTLMDLRDPEVLVGAARSRWLGRLAAFGYRRLTRLFDAMPLRVKDATALDRMSSDTEINRLLIDDPLIGRRWVSGRLFRTAHTYSPPREDLDLPCPLLLAHPGADRWTKPALSLKTFERVRTEKRYLLLPGGAHAPFEATGFGPLTEAAIRFVKPAR